MLAFSREAADNLIFRRAEFATHLDHSRLRGHTRIMANDLEKENRPHGDSLPSQSIANDAMPNDPEVEATHQESIDSVPRAACQPVFGGAACPP